MKTLFLLALTLLINISLYGQEESKKWSLETSLTPTLGNSYYSYDGTSNELQFVVDLLQKDDSRRPISLLGGGVQTSYWVLLF